MLCDKRRTAPMPGWGGKRWRRGRQGAVRKAGIESGKAFLEMVSKTSKMKRQSDKLGRGDE